MNNLGTSSTRAPRLRAHINGMSVDSIIHAHMTNSGSYKSSRFELTISTTGNSSKNRWLDRLDGKVSVEINIATKSYYGEVTIFQGLADSISVDSVNHIAQVSGRDYSSVLSSSSYQASFCNQTSSEIADSIAARHGFNSNIQTTSVLVGAYQCDGYNHLLLNAHSKVLSEWELLKQLAIHEEFELFVDGTTLVFAPSTSLPNNNISIGPNDIIGMKFIKNCPLAGQTKVAVKSWNSWLNQAVLYGGDMSPDQATASLFALAEDPDTEIAVIRPNLTPQDAERLASQRLDALGEQELTVHISMLGDVTLKPRDTLTVNGVGPIFNTNYTVKTVRRDFSSTAGFVQNIQGFAMGQANSVALVGDQAF